MKTLKRVLSVVVALTMLMSMMTFTVLANNTATIDVTYYTDAAMGTVATKVAPGESVYALLTLNLPQATFKSSNLNVTVANATLAAEANGTLWDAVLNSEMAGRLERATGLPGQNALGNFAISKVLDASKPWDSEWDENANIASETVPLILYKLDVADDATGNVSVAVEGSLDIGYYDEGDMANYPTPFTVNANSLPIESAAAPDVITTRYEITKRPSEFIDPELSEAEMIEAIKAQVEVTKYTTTNGVADAGVVVTDQCTFSDFNFETRQALVTYPVDALNTSATSNSIGWEFMALEYSNETVTIASEFEYAMTEEEIAETAEVTARKRKGNTYSDYTLVEDEDYTITVTFDTDANSGTWAVEYIGRFAGKAAANGTFTRTNAPVSYKDLEASISGSPFAYDVTEENIKSAVAVKGTKVEGVVETTDFTVPLDAYTVTVDMVAKTALVAMNDGTEVANANLTFEISEETFEVGNFSVEYTGATEYDYTTTVDFTSLITVEGVKTYEGGREEFIDVTNDVIVTVDKEANTITVAWKDGSAYAGYDILNNVISVTFNDVITYANATATMSKTSFADDATDDAILAFLTVTVEKLVNGVKEDGFVADYMATVDKVNNKVIVEFDDEYGIEDKEVAITFYSSDAVVLKVVGGEGVTAGEVEESDGEFKAIVKVEGLDTRVLYDADLAISASAGVLEEVAVVTGSGYNVLPGAAIAGNVWTGTIYKGIEAVDLANGLLVVTVNTDGLADGTVIEVKVDSATLRMVEGLDFVAIDNTTEVLEVEVNAFVRNVEDVTLNDVEIDIVTLGPVTDAKFVDGVSLTAADGTEIDLTGKVTLNGTNRSIVIDDVALAVSDTENVVKYTLKVEVAGYTTIESEIVVSYNGVATNDWTVTDTLADAKIYAADVTGDDNTIAADDYSDVVAMYNQTAAFDIYEGNGININDISTTVYMYDNYGMRLVNKATGVIAD